ncbi:MAG: hypothetical protein LWX56_02690 [Ignavibacteria bacterium]|nr:hypothetical protein [Ignavibacteria bacterium]
MIRKRTIAIAMPSIVYIELLQYFIIDETGWYEPVGSQIVRYLMMFFFSILGSQIFYMVIFLVLYITDKQNHLIPGAKKLAINLTLVSLPLYAILWYFGYGHQLRGNMLMLPVGLFIYSTSGIVSHYIYVFEKTEKWESKLYRLFFEKVEDKE